MNCKVDNVNADSKPVDMPPMDYENPTYDQFKQAAAEFFRETAEDKDISFEQAVNGEKLLGLMFLNNRWPERERLEAMLILEMAQERSNTIANKPLH